MDQRAYSVITLKSVDEASRTFTGIATTPTPDRMQDVVEPEGAKFTLPIPLLWQHDSRQPIGHVTAAKVGKDGISVTAKLVKIDEPGKLKDRLDEAWQSLKSGLVRGLSIGFRGIETQDIKGTWGVRFVKWDWLELSAVTVAANADCSITAIKSIDTQTRAALGLTRKGVVRLDPADLKSAAMPGVPGTQQQAAAGGASHSQTTKGTDMNIAEQLAAFETKRAAALAKMESIMAKSGTDMATLDEHDEEEYDTAKAEVDAIDKHIARLKTHEAVMIAKATPITPAAGQGEGAIQIRGTGPISVRRNVPPGTAFTRYVTLLALSKGNLMQAEVLSKKFDDSTPEVGIVLKTAVAAGSTSDTTWAAPLVQYNDMTSEFIELLRPQTILGRLTGLRRVPFNIRIPRQTAGTSGTFVGEGSPTPVQKLSLDNITLPWAKASTIVVVTAELARLSNPSAEALVRQDLIDGISQYLDKRLIDPAYSGVANVSPASLTYNVTAVQASGATLAAIDANVRSLMTTFSNAELGLQAGVWVMSASLAIRLSMMRTNQDFKAFPELTMNGGSFYGLPVIVSNNVAPSGSPGDQHLILIDQSNVLLADDGQVMIDVSTEASVEMNDAPSGGATSLRSLWQNGLMGVKVDRWVCWTKRRSEAVQYIDKAQSYAS